MATCVNTYYSGQGIFYVGDRDGSGNPTGLRSLGNVPSMEISIDVTKFEHKESCSGTRAVDLTIVQEKNGTFTMTLENHSAKNLALALWGADTVVTGTTVTDEAVTAYHDKVSLLANINLTAASVTVTGGGGTPTYVEDTDYTIDYKNGTLTALSTGAIADLASILVDYTFGTYTRVDAMTLTSQEKYLRFEGLNTVDNKTVVVDIFKASFDPVATLPLLNDEIQQIELTGNILYDSLQTGGSNYFQERLDPQ